MADIKLTQRQRAFQIVHDLQTQPLSEDMCLDLQAILSEAHNCPPAGRADGSIDSRIWFDLNQVYVGMRKVLSTLKLLTVDEREG